MRIIALLAVYNEAKILGRTLRWLADQGVESYVIDNDSTDDSRAVAEALLGSGVVGVETLARNETFDLEAQLRRKEQLAADLKADWYIHHDADEIRQAPAEFQNLASGLAAVDRAGHNAVDFHEFAFMPTSIEEDFEHENFIEEMRYYCFIERDTFAKHRINAWKNLGRPIDLASSAGHQVRFQGRKVYPKKFILRHYLALSREHVLRKYCDRQFRESELSRGWHGARATIRVEDVELPKRSELKRLGPGADWDLSDPWRYEPLFRKAPTPSARSKQPG